MTEWVTTGQLIDSLKVGEIAQLEEDKWVPTKYGPAYAHVTKTAEGDIKWCKIDGSMPSSSPVHLYGHVIKWKWRVLPKYISFGDAMKAIEDGKDVVCFFEGEKITIESHNGKVCSILYGTHGVMGGGASLKIAYMVAGKWMLKEDAE